jgi:2-dehydro-3-deoxyphosphogalactonate aldolase
VLRRADVGPVQAAGGQLIVAPNFDARVVHEARDLGLACLPGVATPTEAFAALEAGATGLKLFPGEMIPPAAVKALRAVLPPGTLLLPVGGVTPGNAAAYRASGADGLGIGSALYKPGRAPADVAASARAFADAWSGTIRA